MEATTNLFSLYIMADIRVIQGVATKVNFSVLCLEKSSLRFWMSS